MIATPCREAAGFAEPGGELIGASAGAWRWLGWVGVVDGKWVRLPAETFGPLPVWDEAPAAVE